MNADEFSAAEYALGLMRGEERRALERRIAADPELSARVERWEMNFAMIGEVPEVAPPDDMLDRIVAAIGESELPGTETTRADKAIWLDLSPGVTYRILHDDLINRRRSMLIRMIAGATYESHHHDEDEECLVIEGDLRFGPLLLKSGDFHLARKGMTHPPAATVSGCLLYVTAALQ